MEAVRKRVPLTLITGNKKKLEEFMSIMSEDLASKFIVNSKEIDCKYLLIIHLLYKYNYIVDELQGDPEFIASRKVKAAASIVSNPVIVDDVSLCFNVLKGLPGPYM